VEKVDDYEKRVATEYPYLTQSDNPEKVRPVEVIIL
jgi:ATP phosphoribosyltransferase